MLSLKREHDFSGSEVLGEVSGDRPEELLGPAGALLGPGVKNDSVVFAS